jgi:hypothetical protein
MSTAPRPLPRWYLATLFAVPVGVLSPWDLTSGAGELPILLGLLLFVGIHWPLEVRVHRRAGVAPELELQPAVLVPVLAYLLVAAATTITAMGCLEGRSGYPLTWTTAGFLLGTLAVTGAVLQHHLIQRASGAARGRPRSVGGIRHDGSRDNFAPVPARARAPRAR